MISTTTPASDAWSTASAAVSHRPEVLATCEILLRRLGWTSPVGRSALQCLGFTSCYPGEGVSTIAAHVALAAAQLGSQRVALVDLNFARPSAHQTLELALAPGARDILAGGISLADAVQFTALERFAALTAGTSTAVGRTRHSAAMPELMDDLRAAFDLVVFDLPPCDMTSDTLAVAEQLDGVCLVVEAERVRAEVAQRAKDLLLRGGAHLVGAVLNKQPRHVPNWLYRTL